jgi:hypothetical protein
VSNVLSLLFEQSLVPSTIKSALQQEADPSRGTPQDNNAPKQATKQNDHGHPSLPERPPTAVSAPTRQTAIHTTTRDRDQIKDYTLAATLGASPTNKHDIDIDDSSRLPKKQKKGDANIGPSLLSRLESPTSNGLDHRSDMTISAKHTSGGPPTVKNDQPPLGGYSIKGAASHLPASDVETSPQTWAASPTSLLDRLHDKSDDNRVIQLGRKKKRRGKAP